MKKVFVLSVSVLFPFILWGQIKVTSEEVENQDLSDYFSFERIEYQKLIFTSKELKDKTFRLSVKEIWDGEVTKDSTVIDSKNVLGNRPGYDYLKIIGDTIFTMRVISKLTEDCKLKMQFSFPLFGTTQSFDAISSIDYSLRKAVETKTVEFGKKFYVLVYMLPYEKDGMKHWCAVEASGKEIETWGKEFGIKHYLVFEMIFENL